MLKTGLIHIYCGNGKGKTTTGMGLCARAAGYGYRVMIYQFMKNNKTSERNTLKLNPNITWIDGLEQEKFTRNMTDEEKQQRREYYDSQLRKVTELAVDEQYQVLFLDEAVYAIRAGLLDERLLLDFLDHKPEDLEVILTGRDPSEALQARADYISEICLKKHPFQQGIPARPGIER